MAGFIPQKILQQAIEESTVRMAMLKMAKQGDYFKQISGGTPPPATDSNGAYQTDGSFVGYCIYDIGVYDVDPYGP